MYLPKLSYVAGDVTGTVTVTIKTKNGDYLGNTLFTYVDQDEEMVIKMLNSKRLQRKFFTKLGQSCDNDESEENNTQTFGKVELCHSLIMSVHGLAWLKATQVNMCCLDR